MATSDEGRKPDPLASPANSRKADFRGLFGLLKAEHGVSLEEMDAAIKQHTRTKFDLHGAKEIGRDK